MDLPFCLATCAIVSVQASVLSQPQLHRARCRGTDLFPCSSGTKRKGQDLRLLRAAPLGWLSLARLDDAFRTSCVVEVLVVTSDTLSLLNVESAPDGRPDSKTIVVRSSQIRLHARLF